MQTGWLTLGGKLYYLNAKGEMVPLGSLVTVRDSSGPLSIKRFNQNSTPSTELLPMFDDESELRFATDLLDKAIREHSQFEELINTHLKGWEADRIADMDRVILEAALAEITEFDNIAISVSMNEYIELAKEYSGDKSYQFINGILNEILRDMKEDNSLLKASTLR